MVSKTTFKIKLSSLVDVSDLDTSEKNKVKEELGEFLVDKILSDTANRKSAVTGENWRGLSKNYKKIKSKIAAPVANLELHGDMLNALEARSYRDGVEIGIFDKEQAQKSDNHNKFSAKSWRTPLPQRQFIPKEGQNFRPGIMKKAVSYVKDLIEEMKEE